MKTLITIATFSLGISLAQAQTVKEADVPGVVKQALKKQHPTAKVEKWEKEGANYEVEFQVNKIETCALYDEAGKFLESEIEIKESELPKGVAEYVSKNMSGKKIKESSKITNASGIISFEAEIDKTDYIFDANGAFLKKEAKEKDEDKD